MNKWQPTAAVTMGSDGASPAAIVHDGDDDLAIRNERVQPDQARCGMRGEGMLSCVCQSFVYREGEIVGNVIINEAVDPSAEGPAQDAGIVRGRRNGYVKLGRSYPLRR
jgi:hypothetical protein